MSSLLQLESLLWSKEINLSFGMSSAANSVEKTLLSMEETSWEQSTPMFSRVKTEDDIISIFGEGGMKSLGKGK